MSLESDAQQVLQLQQQIRDVERKHDDDIRDIRNAYEQGRRDASLAMAAFLTLKMYDLGNEKMQLYISTLLNDAEKPVVEQGRQIEQLRRDFEAYKASVQKADDAQTAQNQVTKTHRLNKFNSVIATIGILVSALVTILTYLGLHIFFPK